MPTTKRLFAQGKMSLDIDERLLKQGEYREALNIRVSNSEGSDVGAIEKSLSNKVLTTLSLGENIYTLGRLRDEFEEKIYWAVLSDNGCYIIEHEVETGTTTFVLQDTRSGLDNVLGFMPDKRLQMALIVDSDNDNRLLAFTDNNTQPKCINVERAKTTYAVNGFDEEMILLIKKPPLFAPTITLENTGNQENNIEEKFLRFFTRFKYLDGEYSALSPSSQYAFEAKSFNYDYSIQSNKSMVNDFNRAVISFDTGGPLVTDVELVFKESGSNTFNLVESFNKDKKSWADNTFETFDFTNNKLYRTLPEKELYRLYDNVPLLAKSLAVINNRIVFGNYTENYDLIDDLGDDVNINFTVDKVETAITLGNSTTSLKSIRDYEVAKAYYDNYGRMTTLLTSENNTLNFNNTNCITKNEIKVTIPSGSKPPEFAKYYRFFIKHNRIDYDSIIPTLFYQDGVFVWVKLEGGDKDKVKEGDYLYVKSDSEKILDEVVQTKILEIKEQDADFLGDAELPGIYFKIKPDDNFRINEDDFTFYEFEASTISLNSDFAGITAGNVIRNEVNVIENATYISSISGLNDMTSSGTYTGVTDIRYLVDIFSLATPSTGSVELTGGTSGSVDSITVNGVEIMSGVVNYDVAGLDATATNVASNITSHTSSPNYSAIAVGSSINITSEDTGRGSNTFIVTSSLTTITSTDTNMSGAIDDTFRWSNDNGSNWDDNASNGYEITTAIQNIENGIEVTFDSATGHLDTDQWVVSAKSKDDNNFGGEESNRSYGLFKSIETDIIEAGAVIKIHYYENGDERISKYFSKISSKKYPNLEEWFYGDSIEDDFDAEGIPDSRIWFRKGSIGETNGFNYFTQDQSESMCMLIRTENSEDGTFDSDTAKTTTELSIFQSDQNIILETKPIETNTNIFYEIGQTYNITGGYHIGNGGSDQNQTDVLDAEIILPVFNCFAWGNGFESYKIKDEFLGKTMKIDTRPSTTIENYRQNKRIASYTYSNVYEQTTNYNAINEFNLGLVNYNDLDDKYGGIQAMVSWDNDLDVWQEDKVTKVLYDKSVLYNQDGSSNLAKSDDILKNVIPYAGEYGISTHPESLAVYGNYTYWADAKRGAFVRKGQSGIEVISNFGIRDWTRDNMTNLTTYILGCYDPYFGQYVVSLNGYTLTFNELGNAWTSFHSWIPDEMVRINNRFFTFKDGQLYLHNDSDNPIVNTFYLDEFDEPIKYPSKVETIINEAPSEDKIFKNIIQESTRPWKVTIETNLSNGTIEASEFNQRESKWFAHTRKNESASLNGKVQGIGNIVSINANEITFGQMPTLVSIGETLYQLNTGVQEEVGVISDIQGNVITVSAIITTPITDLFAYSVKDARVQGGEIRGYYAKVTLENDDDANVELFAINSNIIKSFAPTEHN